MKGIITLKKKHEICHIFDYKLGTNNPMNIIVVHKVCCTNDLVSTTYIYIYLFASLFPKTKVGINFLLKKYNSHKLK